MKTRAILMPILLTLALVSPGVALAKRVLPQSTEQMQLSFGLRNA